MVTVIITRSRIAGTDHCVFFRTCGSRKETWLGTACSGNERKEDLIGRHTAVGWIGGAQKESPLPKEGLADADGTRNGLTSKIRYIRHRTIAGLIGVFMAGLP